VTTTDFTAPRFGTGTAFGVGVEDELLLVDGTTLALAPGAVDLLARLDIPDREGRAKPDTYAAMVELTTPVCGGGAAAAEALSALRARVLAAGGTVLGAGIHPDGGLFDVEHFPAARYRLLDEQVRGLLRRTPTAAIHVHVGMPDTEAAMRAFNGLRGHLPVLGALAANSPLWHGRDSGLASARSVLFRGYRSAEIPRAFDGYDDYAETIAATVAAGDLPDYTFLWWDVRPHPRLGTVEVRGMDAQFALPSIAGLSTLVQALARREADRHGPWAPREAIVEASFAAHRDGLDARLPLDGRLRPARELVAATLAVARPYARELGTEAALDEVERIVAEGNGADRQRAAHARGGMPALLTWLAQESGRPYG
jgi:glutamate---cysteine ligase / carboxylate-amine ligase